MALDAAGNTTVDSAEGLSFTYGPHDRMLEAYHDGVLQATYVYDGFGRRAKKVETVGAQRTFVYHYGLNGELIGETVFNSSGQEIDDRQYIWLGSLPLGQWQAQRECIFYCTTNWEFFYLHADQLNTPRLATDWTGTVVWRWHSDAFGIGDADTDPDLDESHVDVPLRFPGQYFDEETGLHYNYFRDYDPMIGRYVESDPIGLEGGLNTYGYALQNPTSYMDPTGEGPISVTVCVLGFTANTASTIATLKELADETAAIESQIEGSCNSDGEQPSLAEIERLQAEAARLSLRSTRSLLIGSLIDVAILTICVPLSFILP